MTAQEYIDACNECRTPQRAAELLRVSIELAEDDIRVRGIAERMKCTIERERAASKAAIQQYSEQVARLTKQVEKLTEELEEKRIELEESGRLNALISRFDAKISQLDKVSETGEAAVERLGTAVEQLNKLSAEKPPQDKPAPKPKKQQSKKADSKEPRARYGEYKHVLLTGTQYARLVKEFGAKTTDEYIRKVDEYCQQFGKSYTDYNLTVRKFMREDNIKKEAEKAEKSGGGHSYDLDKILDHSKNMFKEQGARK